MGHTQMHWILVVPVLAQLSYLARGVFGADNAFICTQNGGEDWPTVQRELLRLLDGGKTQVLAEQLSRAASSHLRVDAEDCLPGRIALRLLLLVTGPSVSAEDAEQIVGADWHALGVVGWPTIIRSGWPVFRLLHLLQNRIEREASAEEGKTSAIVPSCNNLDESFSALLIRHVRQRRVHESESLLGASAVYLADVGIASTACPLSAAAAFLTPAWGRFPVYDAETEDMLRIAQPLVTQFGLSQILSTRHALLHMLNDIASMYQAFLIDSGALYEDLRPTDADAPQIDYTRHMMNDRGTRVTGGHVCPWASLRTPLGYCNPFAHLGSPLSLWRRRGVTLEDIFQALRVAKMRYASNNRARQHQGQSTVVLFRHIGHELVAVGASGSEDNHQKADVDSAVVGCLAQDILSVLDHVSLPDFDIVVNCGGAPVIPRLVESSSEELHRAGRQADVAPLFSLCASSNFLDLPFPSACGSSRCRNVEVEATRSSVQRGLGHGRMKPCSGARNVSHVCDGASAKEANLAAMLANWQPPESIGEAEDMIIRDDGFAWRCYLFQMLASYGELLRYSPGHVQTAVFGRPERPIVRTFKSRRPRLSSTRTQTSDFEAACKKAVDFAAQ